jgi:UDP-3-O-[3-hydroxymyristoyl] glucosamine N-acyltransferase
MPEAGLTLGAIAAALGATLDGDPARTITGVAPLEAAGPEHVSFCVDDRHREAARNSGAAAVVIASDAGALPMATLRVRAPRQALIRLLRLFHPATASAPGVHPTAVVGSSARVDATAAIGALAVIEDGAEIGADVRIHPLVYIGRDAVVGEGSELYPHVVLRDGVRLGRRVVVHPGAVIGADGFGYAFDGAVHQKIPQVGTVVVEDDVEIGANTTIDRATLGATVIRRGTKVDNLVQVGHNVEVGEHSILVSQVGISGSSRLGRGVVLGGQVGVADHVTLGDGVMVGAQSGIHADLEPGAKVLGTPARPITLAKRIFVTEGHLPDLVRRVRELERRLSRVEAAPEDRPPSAGRGTGETATGTPDSCGG